MTTGPDRVVVLYSHPLLGEGLGRMLAAEPGLLVTTVDLGTIEALDEALAANPNVVVFEEGGPIGILDVLRRSGVSMVVDVDINSSTAWTIQRHELLSAPDEVLGAIRDALASRHGIFGREGAGPSTNGSQRVSPAGASRSRVRIAASEG